MRTTLKSFLLIALVLPGLLACGQTKPTAVRKADESYQLLAFARAIKEYDRVYKKLPDYESHATIRLAECYRLINDPVNAEIWLAKAVVLKESQPIHKLYYAQALMQNAKYDEARRQFEIYAEYRPDDSRGWNGIEACSKIEEFMRTQDDYAVINMPFNGELADFGPAFYGNGVVYASEREVERKKEALFEFTGRPFLNMFYSEKETEETWSAPELLTGSADTRFHDGPATFSADQSVMFFTRNNVNDKSKTTKSEDNIVELKIMTAKRGERSTRWQSPKDIGFNDKEFSNGHPTVSYDGATMYFVSSRPGGLGGTDIWISTFNGTWSTPVNLGAPINTEGNEMFPFIAKDSTLYFASDAHPGLGGLDVFFSKMNPATSKFETVSNMGAPINSSRDDFALILKENLMEGYFSSNRPGGHGDDDIYSFVSLASDVEIYVYDVNTLKPIPNAQVFVKLGENVILTDSTNPEGLIHTTVHRNRDFTATASQGTYEPETVSFSTKGVMPGQTVRVEIGLGGKCVVQGVVRDKEIMEPVDKAEVTLTNNKTGQQQVIITGLDGKYRFDVDPGDYTIVAKKEGYARDEGELVVGARSGQPCIVNRDLNLELPQGLVLENIYYDFDKADIREDASTDLQKLLQILNDNPKMRIELGSHTDSRGTHEYNVGLSQRRAQAVVDWLVRHGIDKGRLVAKGYGETTLRNHCENGVPCTEYEHQRNRRTEITVIDENGKRIPGRERYNEPDKKFEFVSGGYYGDAPRVEGTIVPDVPPGVNPDPKDPDKDERKP